MFHIPEELVNVNCEEEIRKLEKIVEQLPPGTIFYVHNGKYIKWFHYLNGEKIYIPAKNKELVKLLVIKKYLQLKIEELYQVREVYRLCSEQGKNIVCKSNEMLENELYREYLQDYYRPISEELKEWMNFPYDRNKKYPEQLIHKTQTGYYVRSKSEALIDFSLFMNKIPFRYECGLQLGNEIVYPDFTIRHPKTGEIYYWEHFGLMDKWSYARKASLKLKLYISHGIIPSIHLITTYETKEHPLTADVIYKIINHYFL